MTRLWALLAVLVTALAAGCGSGGGADRAPAGEQPRGEAPAETVEQPPTEPPRVAPYEPSSSEEYPNAKRIAGRIVQRALTHARGAKVSDVAREAIRTGADTSGFTPELARVVDRSRRAWAEVIYVQLSGVTETSFGAMVVVRQRSEDAEGDRKEVTRVVDVRLARAGGPWRFDRFGSFGGRPAARPENLSPAARRVLDHPSIWMSDTSRWDIYRGRIDDVLLGRLAQVAERFPISIAVLGTGHPPEVWQTTRVSAHTRGAAADIFAVAGRTVIRQRQAGSAAYRLTAEFVNGGASQVGSPWILGPGGSRSFTDAVHQDHIHVQQGAAL